MARAPIRLGGMVAETAARRRRCLERRVLCRRDMKDAVDKQQPSNTFICWDKDVCRRCLSIGAILYRCSGSEVGPAGRKCLT
jgi:hypothetical protein